MRHRAAAEHWTQSGSGRPTEGHSKYIKLQSYFTEVWMGEVSRFLDLSYQNQNQNKVGADNDGRGMKNAR